MNTTELKSEDSFLQISIVSLVLLFAFFLFHSLSFPFFPASSRSGFLSLSPDQASLQSSGSTLNPESLSGTARLVLGQKIDLNQANLQDLEALPAVGPKLAEKIVRYRQEKGGFRTIEDLIKVKGIKEKKFEKIKKFVEIK